MRVHELAREVNIGSKELMDLMASLGISVKSHSSAIDDETVQRIKDHLSKKKESPVKRPRVRIIRRAEEGPLPELAGTTVAPATPVAPPAPAVVPPAAHPAAQARAPAAPPKAPAPKAPAPEAPAKPAVPRVPAARVPMPEAPAKPAPPVTPKKKVVIETRPPAPPVEKPVSKPAAPAAPLSPPAAREAPAAREVPPVPEAPARREPEPVMAEVPPAPPVPPKHVEMEGPIMVGELATRLGLNASDVVKRLIEHGILAGINQQLPFEVARKVAESFNFIVDRPQPAPEPQAAAAAAMSRLRLKVEEAGAQPRAPVVTVMGHVDHGKTSLLDAIRKTRVAEREYGGITQHIGASVVTYKNRRIAFVDTPGHEAFTALRARGAQVTDVAVLVVAADDGVMPQTAEALNHARAAKVPIIVALNKIDLPQANQDRAKQQLADLGLVPEDWGGDTVVAPVSARTGQGIEDLLEMILLVADLQDLRANPNKPAKGTIIEAKLDRGRGPVATVLVQEGTLRPGDAVVAGEVYGRVRLMVNERGERLDVAGPSAPVEVIGLSDVPAAGDLLEAVTNERVAKAITEERQERRKAAEAGAPRSMAVDDMFGEAEEGSKELRLIIKADVHGSAEALQGSLRRLETEEVRVNVLHAAVGNATESDVMLAAASRAVVIGFNVRPEAQVRRLAEQEKVDIRLYRVIYEATEDVKNLLRGMTAPKVIEVVLGRAEVRQTFDISRLGRIAGSYVLEGRVVRGAQARLVRDGAVVYDGRIGSLRRFKEDVREVAGGFECGIGLERFQDVKAGDVIEVYAVQQVR